MSLYSDHDGRADSLGRIYHRAPGPKPQPRHVVATQAITVYVTPTERQRAQLIASEQQVSLSQLLRDALDHYVESSER
jgi:predicted HicB family RNase H-like nuclease